VPTDPHRVPMDGSRESLSRVLLCMTQQGAGIANL
jgi:hypothetical protein